MSEEIYISDSYKRALEQLNKYIEEELKMREGRVIHSEEFHKSLVRQIELEKEKLALHQQEASRLEKGE